MHKRTEITIETERLLVVSQGPEQTIHWCHGCDQNVPMLTLFAAARAAGTTPEVIAELVEAGKLHLAVAPDGRLFICPNSLPGTDREVLERLTNPTLTGKNKGVR